METTKADIDALAARFLECTPPLDDEGRKISIALYRMMAEGEPVLAGDVAGAIGLDEKRVDATIRSWPGVFFDEHGRVQGYWGLAIPEMNHRFVVAGRTLYTWCAWDSLFLPKILGMTARVSSICPTTGDSIRLSVHPDAIETIEPTDAVMSFPRLDRIELGDDVVTSFCHFVHFFRSRGAARKWLEKHPGHCILSSAEAFELARRKNALQYGQLE